MHNHQFNHIFKILRIAITLFAIVVTINITEISAENNIASPRRPFLFQHHNEGNRLLQSTPRYSYETNYFKQQVDHFGFENEDTYNQRYLIANQYWNKNGGPIFFYTGNEGDIELFCENTGFMWDIAPLFKALLVFAEHRYYGKSLPYGSVSYKNASTLNYLTSEQALADFAELIKYIKQTIPGAANSQVIVFGGSYGGMLSAWMRLKYPNLVLGALAASAPIWQFSGVTPCNAFYDTTTATWQDASQTCVSNIHQSYTTFPDIASQASSAPIWSLSGLGNCGGVYSMTGNIFNISVPHGQCAKNIHTSWYTIESTASGMAGGYDFISSTFNLCTPLKDKYDLGPFMAFLANTYVNFAMVNYPYPANFLADLPGWPIKAACQFLSQPLEGKALLAGLSKVTNLYYNYTGKAPCLDWTGQNTNSSLGLQGWDYQACTEMVMPMCSNNSGMFYNMPWNFQSYSDACYQSFKVRPRENWITLEYWAKQLKAASNIIFSNGLYDPWSSGGVMQTISDTVVAIQIPQGAHHYDLRARNDLDTPSVKAARDQEKNIIRSWLGLTSSG